LILGTGFKTRPHFFISMFPKLGCGLGLRHQHYPAITETWPKVDWFEAVSENYMDTGGRPLHILEKVREHYPIALHGTALSIGSTDPLNPIYLEQLKKLADQIDPFIVSDHLCWSGTEKEQLHDLLPLPFTEEAVCHVADRIQQVQEYLNRKILIENVSTYVTYRHSEMAEWEFLTEVAKKSGCGILLDINNIYVNSFNHQFDPLDYLKNLPGELIGQIHLAGHTDMGSFLFDTHSAPVIERVWELYRETLKQFGQISTLIEWDEHIPTFERLREEAEKAKVIYQEFEHHQPKATYVGTYVGQKNKMADKVSLVKIEHWMKSKIQPASKNSAEDLAILNPQGGAKGEERLSVYADGYVARIRESLKEVYEAVHFVLGDERFNWFCRDYAFHFPSHHYNLNFAGIYLPEFLAGHEHLKQFPFLSDLAKLEWLIWKAFHAFDGPPLNPEALKNISADDWETLKLVFQPSVSLISSSYSILDIWQARKSSSPNTESSKPQKILVGRRQDQVRCELLNIPQFKLLEGLLSGQSLGNVCEILAEDSDEELPIAAWFSNWVQDGLILRFELAPKSKVNSSS
jgi:uncharacterized protein